MTMTAGLIEDLRQQLAAAEAENERLCRVYAGICVTIVQAGIPVFGTAEEGVQKLAADHDRAVKDAERWRHVRAVFNPELNYCIAPRDPRIVTLRADSWDQMEAGIDGTIALAKRKLST